MSDLVSIAELVRAELARLGVAINVIPLHAFSPTVTGNTPASGEPVAVSFSAKDKAA